MKRVLMILLPFLLIAATFVLYNAEVGYEPSYWDTEGHWAERKIENWSDRGVITGSYGAFRPDEGLSRSEMCAIISRVTALPEPAENVYSDLESDKWYTELMLRCIAAGVFATDGGLAEPDRALSRQEGLDMMRRAFGVEEALDMGFLQDYFWRDSGARGFGYDEAYLIEGSLLELKNGELDPDAPLTRAELVFMLDACTDAGYIEK